MNNLLIWILRFRKRKGYGVHSPFAFNFMTRIINEKAQYYSYEKLPKKDTKINRLIFRIVNYAQPKTALIHGTTDEVTEKYIKAAKRNIKIIKNTDIEKVDKETFPIHFLLIKLSNDEFKNKKAIDFYIKNAANDTIFVFLDIRKEKSIWKDTIHTTKNIISFDLYNIGIICFSEKLLKQEYKVNF